ncbi:histidine-rich protein PFHRP-II [Anopheles ziemanni]|uniref:histidine-rich protein PFHRP-II n=1 Tax=Anopheles ziemanni TaxID=345580 RepID=UPI00265D7B53|nr:histidine-rich protein PFHRP-II [Anopheles ziemanni]
MKAFVLGSAVLLLATASASGSYLGVALSSQYQAHDGIGGYSYGYAEPNSQKHESKDAHGVTHGGYSYVDANGHVQSVKYTADPIHGFRVAGTNLPQGPAPVHAAPAPAWNAYAYAPVVLGHNGAPIDTPEVQHAKAAHFAAHAAAKARLHKRSLYASYPWSYGAAAPVVLGHNGVPLDTPEVAHAKAEHAAAHAKALGYAHPAGPVPDTPEVAHAKAEHAAAHAAARANQHALAPAVSHSTTHAIHAHHAPAAHYPQHVPVIKNGVPVETPEVQHAKAAHFAAVAKAGGYAPAHAHSYYPQHIPVIHNGVPVETPEVQHAKAAHYAALAEAGARAGWSAPAGHEDDGSYDGRWDNHY